MPGLPDDIRFRPVATTDASKLYDYFSSLSDQSKARFGPHSFDWEHLNRLCKGLIDDIIAFVADEGSTGRIVGYMVTKRGYIQADKDRYSGYSIESDPEHTFTLAPSVADDYQSAGLGSRMMKYVLAQLKVRGAQKVVLWGGVQAGNSRACHFYQKFGFRRLGDFEHNGNNYDMALNVADFPEESTHRLSQS